MLEGKIEIIQYNPNDLAELIKNEGVKQKKKIEVTEGIVVIGYYLLDYFNKEVLKEIESQRRTFYSEERTEWYDIESIMINTNIKFPFYYFGILVGKENEIVERTIPRRKIITFNYKRISKEKLSWIHQILSIKTDTDVYGIQS